MNTNILFIGDSLIEFYDWASRFPQHRVTNLGRCGETVQELEHRCQKGDFKIEVPEWIFIMIGTNNVAMADYSFFISYQRVIETMQQKYPSANIIIHGLFPMRLPWMAEGTISRLNDEIKNLAMTKNCGYLDGCEIFNNDLIPASQNFEADGVHLSDTGYRLWATAIEKHLT